MIELLVWAVALIPLDIISPSPIPTRPVGSGGFAAGILGGFFGLGIIVLAAVLLTLKPKRAQPPRPNYGSRE